MANVNNRGQTPSRGGNQTRQELVKKNRDGFARDDLRGATSGGENRGPADDQKESFDQDTHLSSRRINRDSDRTPVR